MILESNSGAARRRETKKTDMIRAEALSSAKRMSDFLPHLWQKVAYSFIMVLIVKTADAFCFSQKQRHRFLLLVFFFA